MANETKSFFKELKDATFDYKSFFKTIGKDFLSFVIIAIISLSYTLFLLSSAPTQPGWAQEDNIAKASTLEIQMMNQELSIYLIKFTLLTILLIFATLAILTLFKEWVWKDLTKEKHSIKNFFKFLSLNTIIYSIISIIVVIIGILAGSIILFLGKRFVPAPIILSISLLFMIPTIFLFFHFLNFSGYKFLKTRKFGNSIIETFKSFSKIKKLLAPYIIILIVILIFGIIVNILLQPEIVNTQYQIKQTNIFLVILAYIIFFAVLAWEKVYSSYFFKRIYN